MARPKIETDIKAQVNILNVLNRSDVKRSLRWLSKESNISYALLHHICSGKRRLHRKHEDKILFALKKFKVDVTTEEIFIK